ncbi:MAG: SpaA isopeptide-forming pilin-related protein [Verrucomicrobia bacterium]|nr:SpaA isopeptide-forming pilin-related protein [Verrucomicrobiota bacterium]
MQLPSTVCFSVANPGVIGDRSYLDVTLLGVNPLVLDGWCVDTDTGILPNRVYTARVYALGDPEVPGFFDAPGALDNLDLVLYILNQNYPGKTAPNGKLYTYGDVQRAIWTLVEDEQATGGLGSWQQDRVNAILEDAAANGEGYSPGCGDTTILFLNPVVQGCDPQTPNTGTMAQIIIVEVPLECASIGDFVWQDFDYDGIQDAHEPGVAGVTVQLLDCLDNVLAETTTDADGYYLFADLIPGNYRIRVLAPDGYVLSPQDQGSDDALDSDADANGLMACTTLEPGEHDPTWDAGLYLVPTNPGTGTPGYWKNHPAAWPVESITIGGITYTKAEAIARLGLPDGDKRNTLFRALVCATLNVLIGNDSSCIAETIEAGNLWWATYSGSRVAANSTAWRLGEPLARRLDAYNNGLLCAPHRN